MVGGGGRRAGSRSSRLAASPLARTVFILLVTELLPKKLSCESDFLDVNRENKMPNDYKKRQEEILVIIINQYIETAKPVGSRFVARRLGLSSATIRNAMVDLEEMGYITHPHTSAGRIPTDKGYRFYIDSLMHLRRVNENIVKVVDDEYREAMRSLESVLEKTSHLVSHLTNYVGIALYPPSERVYLDGASHIVEQPQFKDFM